MLWMTIGAFLSKKKDVTLLTDEPDTFNAVPSIKILPVKSLKESLIQKPTWVPPI